MTTTTTTTTTTTNKTTTTTKYYTVILSLPWPTHADRRRIQQTLTRRVAVKQILWKILLVWMIGICGIGGVACLVAYYFFSGTTSWLFPGLVALWSVLFLGSAGIHSWYAQELGQLDDVIQRSMIQTFAMGMGGGGVGGGGNEEEEQQPGRENNAATTARVSATTRPSYQPPRLESA